MIVDGIYGKRILEFVLLSQPDEILLEIKCGCQLCKCKIFSLQVIDAGHRSGMENAAAEINVIQI